MNLTPYLRLTDNELMREVMNKPDATALEIELMLRLEKLHDELEDWHSSVSTRYVGEDR